MGRIFPALSMGLCGIPNPLEFAAFWRGFLVYSGCPSGLFPPLALPVIIPNSFSHFCLPSLSPPHPKPKTFLIGHKVKKLNLFFSLVLQNRRVQGVFCPTKSSRFSPWKKPSLLPSQMPQIFLSALENLIPAPHKPELSPDTIPRQRKQQDFAVWKENWGMGEEDN